MCARSWATRCAIARTAESIVPSAGSRTDSYAASAARAKAAATSTGSTSSPGREASSSAAPRTICDRITPLLPRAPSSAARATALTSWSRPISSIICPFRRSSSSSTARIVIAMLSPVSPSATGNTFRSLTSWRRRSSSAHAFATTLRKRTNEGSGTALLYTERPRGLGATEPVQTCFRTLPAFRQRVQTYSRRGAPSTEMRTFCRFALKRRLVATIEWLRLCPNAGPFPHE